MYPCLAEVRRRVEAMVHALFREVRDLRIGIIAHGDYCDRQRTYVYKTFPFSKNQNALCEWVSVVGRTGGGDQEECYELVFKVAREEFDWRPGAKRVMVLIADDVPHEVGYRQFGSEGLDWKEQASLLLATGVIVYPVQCLNHMGTHWFYNELAKMSGTPKLDLHQFNNAVELITAIAFVQEGTERLEQYARDLESAGLFNRGLARAVAALSGGTSEMASREEYTTYRGGLVPVPPGRFQTLNVDSRVPIREFVNATGVKYKAGKGFYELVRRELVQERKEVVLRDQRTGDLFTGKLARELLGLPYGVRGNVSPSDVVYDGRRYDVFIQSTSYNRILKPGTEFLYEVLGRG